MSRWRPFLETVHATALAVWLAALLGSGAAAAVLFPTMKSLAPSLEEYSKYPQDHWLIAAGQVAQRVFLIADIAAFPAALIATLSLAGLFAARAATARPALVLRVVGLVVAVACLASMLLVVSPSLNASLAAHLTAARAGDLANASLHKKAFDDLHPIATNLQGAETLAVLVSLVAGVFTAATPLQRGRQSTGSELQEPALLRRGALGR